MHLVLRSATKGDDASVKAFNTLMSRLERAGEPAGDVYADEEFAEESDA